MTLGTAAALPPIAVDPWLWQNTSVAALGSHIIDAAGEKLAFRYMPQTTSPIDAVNFMFNVVGAPGNLKAGVFNEASLAPGSTQYGGHTAGFGCSDEAWTTMVGLGSNTGNLTLGVPLWIVVEIDSGTFDGSNYVQTLANAAYNANNGCKFMARYYTTSWMSPSYSVPCFVVRHVDGTIGGGCIQSTAGAAVQGATDIFGSNRQGIRFRVGSKQTVRGFGLVANKAGSPSALVATLYEGAVSKQSVTIPAANISTSIPVWFSFPSPAALSADADIYLVLSQDGGGGSDTADYDLVGRTYEAALHAAAFPSRYAYVYGTNSDPTALTAATGFCAGLWPLIGDAEADLDCAAGGGGGPLVGSSALVG